MRIGQGFDAHRLEPGRPLMLGGVHVPHDRGLAGHSDGDALLHAVTDALIGALGEGDLGRHFPSSDASLEGVASHVLLERIVTLMHARGYRVANVDATVIAQAPRLAPYQPTMHANLARWLRCEPGRVNVKVTSTDHLGAFGREEGIASLAVALIERAPGPDAAPQEGA
jgi:2-C-methyl-D-erythritol 2,4-cyclodiphosphate synthase